MRLSRAVGAAALALATSIGALAAAPTAATAAAPAPGGEAVLGAEPGAYAPEVVLHAAGKGMLLRERRNGQPTSWQHADGRKTAADCGPGIAAFGDEVACTSATDLKIRDFSTGATESVPAVANRAWGNAFSPTQVLATEKDARGWSVLHLLGRANEPRKDVPVTGSGPMSTYAVVGSDARGAIFEYWNPAEEGGHGHRYLDYATATLRELPRPSGVDSAYNKVALGSKWIAMLQFDDVVMVSRTDPSVVRPLSVPGPKQIMPVGDWLIADTTRGWDDTVSAYPVDGGASRPVLSRLDGPLVLGADGGAYGLSTAVGSGRWAVNGISADAQGAPRVQEALPLPTRPSDRRSIAFAQGDLSALHIDQTQSVLGYRVSVAGPLSVAQAPAWRCDTSPEDPSCQHAAARQGGNAATGDGRIVGLAADSTSCSGGCVFTAYVREARTGGAHRAIKLPGAPQWAGMETASGRHALIRVRENGSDRLLVLDIDAGKVLDVKPASTAGLWGSLLWQPEGDKGVVAATDLRTGQVTRRVDLGSGCRPYELQANGDWFYSTCSAEVAAAAAYHVPTQKRIPVPFIAEKPHGAVQLGDGYLAHDGDGRLDVYNLRSGTAVKEHRVDEFAAGGPGIGFAVDRFGGRLAHLAQDETVHVVGVTGSTSPLAVIDQSVPGTLDSRSATGRQARWWLSKPASSWKLLVRNPASGISTVVRTGGETRGAIDLTWDGKDQSGRAVGNGSYEWTLLVNPADGKGGQHSTTGSVTLSGATSQAGRPTRP
ncbi:hypothetical protein [Streptomyces sp. A0592]|uniref:hypothetical protein n=1 Tax=Streptomyces sp. A0592 TaxID=2563099 RepID=UPI00109EBF8A|nr:hypothetical protein [Streptomyces sp. A0592]THA85609.1 hypothetical protein E6U81_06145 [Streptomyces sp. A0592]